MRIAWYAPAALTAGEALVIEALRDLGHDVSHVGLDLVVVATVPSWRDHDRARDDEARVYVAVDDFAAAAPLFDLTRRAPGLLLFRDVTLDRYFEALWIASGRPRRRPDFAALLASALGIVVPSHDIVPGLAQFHPGPILVRPIPTTFPEAQRYAAHLIDAIEGAALTQPLLRAADHVAALLRANGVRRGDDILGRIASAASDLFG